MKLLNDNLSFTRVRTWFFCKSLSAKIEKGFGGHFLFPSKVVSLV